MKTKNVLDEIGRASYAYNMKFGIRLQEPVPGTRWRRLNWPTHERTECQTLGCYNKVDFLRTVVWRITSRARRRGNRTGVTTSYHCAICKEQMEKDEDVACDV